LERGENFLVPPTGVTKLDHVASCWINLLQDAVQSARGVVVTRRELKKKAAHPLTEQISDKAEIANERLCADESFDMGDVLADFDRVDKVMSSDLFVP
jgi:hypothetical protein